MHKSVQLDTSCPERASGIADMFKVTKKLTSAIGRFETGNFEMFKPVDMLALFGGLLAIAATTHKIYETQFTKDILSNLQQEYPELEPQDTTIPNDFVQVSSSVAKHASEM